MEPRRCQDHAIRKGKPTLHSDFAGVDSQAFVQVPDFSLFHSGHRLQRLIPSLMSPDVPVNLQQDYGWSDHLRLIEDRRLEELGVCTTSEALDPC